MKYMDERLLDFISSFFNRSRHIRWHAHNVVNLSCMIGKKIDNINIYSVVDFRNQETFTWEHQ